MAGCSSTKEPASFNVFLRLLRSFYQWLLFLLPVFSEISHPLLSKVCLLDSSLGSQTPGLKELFLGWGLPWLWFQRQSVGESLWRSTCYTLLCHYHLYLGTCTHSQLHPSPAMIFVQRGHPLLRRWFLWVWLPLDSYILWPGKSPWLGHMARVYLQSAWVAATLGPLQAWEFESLLTGTTSRVKAIGNLITCSLW